MFDNTTNAGAMTLIDEQRETYVVSSGDCLRLWVAGALYAPNDLIPMHVTQSDDRRASTYVIDHLTQRVGSDMGKWPLTVRFFLDDANAYEFSADLNGTKVALFARNTSSPSP